MVRYMPLDTSRFLGSTSVIQPDPVDVPQPSLPVSTLPVVVPQSSLLVVMLVSSLGSIALGIYPIVTYVNDKNTANMGTRLSDESSNANLISGCVFFGAGVVGLIVSFVKFYCGDAIGKWMGCLSSG